MNKNEAIYFDNFTYKNFSYVLNKYQYKLNVGDIVAGKIFNKEKNGYLVEIGAKLASFLPITEISLSTNLSIYTGLIREFFILAYNQHSGQLIISIKRLEYIRAWTRIKQMYEEDIILNLYVLDVNKGGLIVTLEGIQSFIPNSHLLNSQNKKALLGTYLKCKFLAVNEKSNQLILSHKRALLSIHGKQLKLGQVISSKILNIQSYGIFLSVNNIPTLLHISEISNQHIDNINKNFNVGEEIDVQIMHIDEQQGRLSVSRKHLC